MYTDNGTVKCPFTKLPVAPKVCISLPLNLKVWERSVTLITDSAMPESIRKVTEVNQKGVLMWYHPASTVRKHI